MKRTYEEITPEKAKEILKGNYGNRRVSRFTVEQYVRLIRDGKWLETPDLQDSIQISKSGRLLDGQHRLYAIVNSNTPLKMWVVRDVDEVVMKYLDNNKPRGIGDHLAAYGVNERIGGASTFTLAFVSGASIGSAFSGSLSLSYKGTGKVEVGENVHKLGNGQTRLSKAEVTEFALKNAGTLQNIVYDAEAMKKATGRVRIQGFYGFTALATLAGEKDRLGEFVEDYKLLTPQFWTAWAKDTIRKMFDNRNVKSEQVTRVLAQAFDGFKNGYAKKEPKWNYDVPLKALVQEARANCLDHVVL